MNLFALGNAMRWGLMLLLCALAVWLIPGGGQLVFVGVALMAAAAAGFLVKEGREAGYAIGVLALVWGLWLGMAPADSGPYSMANTGYGCGSVFAPPDGQISEDAPPYMARQCKAVVEERRPFVAFILGFGVYSLVRASRLQTTAVPRRVEAPQDAVRGG